VPERDHGTWIAAVLDEAGTNDREDEPERER